MIIIHTDGSCLKNPGGPGAYAYIIAKKDSIIKKSEGYKSTTNNRMEIMAALLALQSLSDNEDQVIVYSDSQYLVNTIAKKWIFAWERKNWVRDTEGTPVKNQDLWKMMLQEIRRNNVVFKWVRGHRDNELNNECDKMANLSAKKNATCIDAGYKGFIYLNA